MPLSEMVLLALVIAFAYPFFLYAPILAFLAQRFGLQCECSGPAESPTVALVICALNEQNVIRQKMENSIALDYPKEKLAIVVVSDGSTDQTASIAGEYVSAGVTLIDQPMRRGKAGNLNEVIPSLTQEIIVFSDANVMYEADAIKKLAIRFADPSVGCVSGKVVLTGTTAPLKAGTEGYYSREWLLQWNASRLHSMMGADGAMYALRRELFRSFPPDTLIEDFIIPMAVIRQGKRVVFEPAAAGWEKGCSSLKEEFVRKTRIAAGTAQGLARGNAWPGRASLRVWFLFLSHKFLRWISPLVGAMALAISLFTLDQFMSKAVALGFLLLSGAAVIRVLLRQPYKAFDAPFYFLFGQIAAGVGLIKGLTGTQSVLWAKADR